MERILWAQEEEASLKKEREHLHAISTFLMPLLHNQRRQNYLFCPWVVVPHHNTRPDDLPRERTIANANQSFPFLDSSHLRGWRLKKGQFGTPTCTKRETGNLQVSMPQRNGVRGVKEREREREREREGHSKPSAVLLTSAVSAIPPA